MANVADPACKVWSISLLTKTKIFLAYMNNTDSHQQRALYLLIVNCNKHNRELQNYAQLMHPQITSCLWGILGNAWYHVTRERGIRRSTHTTVQGCRKYPVLWLTYVRWLTGNGFIIQEFMKLMYGFSYYDNNRVLSYNGVISDFIW